MAATHHIVITRAVGVDAAVSVDLSYHASRPGDLFVLCSDGVSRQVDHSRVVSLLAAEDRSLGDRCADLLDATETAGGQDNATVLLARIRR